MLQCFVSYVSVYVFLIRFFFFFKQKTAYEMRISDWSSDVCSSDLLRARKRLEQGIAISGREGRDRLMRIATVLETVSRVARTGEDIGAALRDIVPLDMLDADAAIIRRTAAPHRDDVLSEIAAEYRTFKR